MLHTNLIQTAIDAADICDLTPGMSRVIDVKLEAPIGTLTLFRMGDFYELFFDDAVNAAAVLNLTLTGKRITAHRDDAARIPMAGIPHHAIARYGPQLTEAGYRVVVAIADGHTLTWGLLPLDTVLTLGAP